MGQYNADVMLQIGKEAHKFILNRVKCGVISTQHMSDISSQLYPHVLGRRVESEKRLSTGTTKRFTILTSRLYRLVSLSASTFRRKEVDQGETEKIGNLCLAEQGRSRKVFHRQLLSTLTLDLKKAAKQTLASKRPRNSQVSGSQINGTEGGSSVIGPF